MPYKNMPQSMWAKMDKCVESVQGKGHDKSSAIAICYTSMMTGKELAETMKSFKLKAAPNYRLTQKASDSPGDYLIVEDREKPTTWHLQVKTNGNPDHHLMGAAWAALHGGYRGNKYEGPNKQDAIAKLKRMYESEDMMLPTEKSIMDAPNLRGDDIQRCLNCKYAQPIVTDEMMDTAMPMSDMTMMETQKEMGMALVCTQYDFQTESEWVCDGYEAIPPMSDMLTMKQADGKYRWVMFSSSSYEDRDNQIVSQKALEDDTAYMNDTQDFGGIGWWHIWILDGQPVNFKELSDEQKLRAHPWMFGKCDFSQMQGRVSIESGTFDDDWLGEMFATQKGLGASREFFNPPPDNGVFNHIRTFSRAILPESHASNRLTLFGVSAKEKNMNVQDKFADLIKRFGNTPEAKAKVEELLKGAAALDQTAAQAGLTAKETQPTPQPENIEAKGDGPESKTASWFVADMTPDEFELRLQSAVEKFLTPAVKEIGAQVAQMNDAQAITAKEQGDKVTASIKSVQDMQTDLAARLAALEGLRPRGYRPTEDPKTQVDTTTVKEKMPKGDKQADPPLAEWLRT